MTPDQELRGDNRLTEQPPRTTELKKDEALNAPNFLCFHERMLWTCFSLPLLQRRQHGGEPQAQRVTVRLESTLDSLHNISKAIAL
jgi:hypothetical protein